MFLSSVKGTGQPAGSAGRPTDPSFDDVVLLVGFNGPDGSTNFIDDGPSAHSLSAQNNAQVDVSDFKFGAASYLGDGADDYIIVNDGPGSPSNRFTDFDFGTGDFTIESWINLTTPANSKHIITRGVSSAANSSWYLFVSAAGQLSFWCRGATKAFAQTLTVDDGEWHHAAVSRDDVNTRIFIDGVIDHTVTDGSPYDITSVTEECWIGSTDSFGAGRSWGGRFDEMRVKKTALYTANFTPPEFAFPRS